MTFNLYLKAMGEQWPEEAVSLLKAELKIVDEIIGKVPTGLVDQVMGGVEEIRADTVMMLTHCECLNKDLKVRPSVVMKAHDRLQTRNLAVVLKHLQKSDGGAKMIRVALERLARFADDEVGDLRIMHGSV